MDFEIRNELGAQLGVHTLYEILRLRSQIFVVEQQDCAYLDLDGRDLAVDTRHVWAERDGNVLGYLRLLRESDGRIRLGRAVTTMHARGQGIGAALVSYGLALVGQVEVVIRAQSRLKTWYEQFGFEKVGPEFSNNNIPHILMVRMP